VVDAARPDNFDMNAWMKIAALALLSVAQLAAATWSIATYESTLKSGTLYRIRTIAVDPADAFRGRYVAVRPSITIARPIAPETEQLLQQIQGAGRGYVVLATDAEGFARAAQIVATPPPQGDYLEIVSAWQQWNQGTQPGTEATFAGYNIAFSFDRYYMNEAAAPAAERRYGEAMRRNAVTKAWLAVRVRNGIGVIEGLFIDGRPIEEVVRNP
jgi:uncharacterized membrane-anchored protein